MGGIEDKKGCSFDENNYLFFRYAKLPEDLKQIMLKVFFTFM